MKHLQDYINEAAKINEAAESKTITFDFTDLYNKYIALRENDLEYIKKKKDEMRASIESQKQVIKKALSDVKIMEKLKEKHLAEYAAYVLKQEELQIDEINITKPRSEVF